MRQSIAPKDLAQAIGVSESSVKRWADEGRIIVSRTAGGHRRILIADAVKFVRTSGAKVERPELLGLSELEHLPHTVDLARPMDTLLYEALERGDAPVVRGLLQSLYMQGSSIATIGDGPFAHALWKIGELWQHAEWGIVIEHRATDILIAAVNQLRLLIGSADELAPIAVGGGAEFDPYILPSLLVSTTLAEAGFKDINLGPRVPARLLKEAAARFEASMVWLSVSVEPPKKQAVSEIIELSESLTKLGVSCLLGGRHVRDVLPVAPAKPAAGVHVMKSLTELSAFAKGIKARGPAV